MQTNILEYLEATAPRLPDKVAYSDGSFDMTFSALLSSSRSVGTALLKKGYSREPIAILMNKHPREIAATVETTKGFCKGRLYVVFRPHTYSRTKLLMEEFMGGNVYE